MTITILLLIIISILLNTAAQLALRAGMLAIGYFNFGLHNFLSIAMKIIQSPWIILGAAAYIFSMFTWLLVLSRTEVSVAYPMISLGYIVSAVAAYYLWGENLNLMRVVGIVIILLGVFIITRS